MELDERRSFISRWQFVRGETLEILGSLTQDQMAFTPPGDKWIPLYGHFSCAAKTQRVYAQSVVNSVMDFSLFHTLELPNREKFQDKKFTNDYLMESNRLWLNAIKKSNGVVVWNGNQNIPLNNHIARLAEHERLHHGQLISYYTLAGFELPPNFKINWSL